MVFALGTSRISATQGVFSFGCTFVLSSLLVRLEVIQRQLGWMVSTRGRRELYYTMINGKAGANAQFCDVRSPGSAQFLNIEEDPCYNRYLSEDRAD